MRIKRTLEFFDAGNGPTLFAEGNGGTSTLLAQATAYLGGIAPLHYWDFVNNRALFASADVGTVTSTPGWSYTRADAQNAYAETSAGVLVPFATGVLRRTDKGALIEASRVNLCLQSQTFDNASWSKSGATPVSVVANAVAAPDETITADTITGNAANNDRVQQNITVANITAYVCSLFVKNVNATKSRLTAGFLGTGSVGPLLTWSGATLVSTTDVGLGTCTFQALANGWYRVLWVFTTGAADIGATPFRLYPAGISGDAGGTASVYAWGFQMEAGAFPSSYILTTTASATRAADVLTVSSPGVTYPLSLYAEFEPGSGSTNGGILAMNASGSFAELYVDGNVRFNTATTGAGASPVTGALTAGTTYKGGGRIDTNNLVSARGGTLGTLDTSATNPTTATEIRFGIELGGAVYLFGYLRRCAVVNSAVVNAGLQAMTS
jgi:hypothetical protein